MTWSWPGYRRVRGGRRVASLAVAALVLPAAVTAGVVALVPATAAAATNPVTAYVTNLLSDSVTPIALATNTPGTPIPVGDFPTGIAITPASPAGTATSTTLGVAPGSPAVAGTVQTLTATLTPSTAAGRVQFTDGTTPIGASVTVVGGSASRTITLAVGTHTLTAVFTPTDPVAFSPSTSAAVSYVVNAPAGAEATATEIRVAPSPAFQGIPVFLLATVAPRTAAGTVQFSDGPTAIGAPVPVIGGRAFRVTSALTQGPHTLTAVFTPTSPAAFGPSMSPPASLAVRSIW